MYFSQVFINVFIISYNFLWQINNLL
jgi:hypothetical protein